jgi:MtN3 and saliva related transmembrane protein
MFNPEYLGYIAATLTTFSFLPQVIRVYQTNDTRAISLKMYAMFVSGVCFWFLYGISIGKLPIVIANFITIILAGLVLLKKIKNLKSDV